MLNNVAEISNKSVAASTEKQFRDKFCKGNN